MMAFKSLSSRTLGPMVWLPWLDVSVAVLPELLSTMLPPVPGLIV